MTMREESPQTPTRIISQNQLETDIQRGKAPKGFKHFHNMHTKGGQEHVHLEDGTSLNKDGSWKDGKIVSIN